MALTRATRAPHPLRPVLFAPLAVAVALTGCYEPTRTSVPGLTERYWAAAELSAPPFESKHLTLADALARAKAHSSSVIAAKAELAARKAQVDAAAEVENPELRIGQLRLDQLTHDQEEVEVKLRVKPPPPLQNDALRAEAEADARYAAADLNEAERETIAAARLAYYETAALDRAMEATKRLAALQERRGKVLEQNATQNRATSLDLALASVDRAKVDDDLATLAGQRRRSLGRLGDAVGLTLPEDVELDPLDFSRLAVVEVPSESALVKLGLENAPELERRAAEIDAAAATVDQERSTQIPWFSFLELGYHFSPGTIDPEGFTFGAGIRLPIFDPRIGAVDAAEAQKTALMRHFDADASSLKGLVLDARREVVAAQQSVGADREKLREAAKAAAREADKAMEVGQLDELSAIKIQSDAAKLAVDDAKAVQRMLEALAELERLTGWKPQI
ncbi:MAG: TolC family protein [Myxococcales bacterium]|nr:TolC family protein [Myxococcales bacterium]